MKKLLIVNYNQAGVGKFRLLDPHIKMSQITNDIEIHFGNDVDLAKLGQGKSNFDMLMIHSSIAPDDNRRAVVEKIQRDGVKLIVDVDDYWVLDSKNQIYKATKKEKFHIKIINLLKKADLVTTTTSILAKEIKKYQKNVIVLPNSVDPTEPQFQPNKQEFDKVRIGYLGGSTHLEDIRMLRFGINRILTSFPNDVQFVLCGFNDQIRDIHTGKHISNPQMSVWSKYETIFTANFSKVSNEYKEYLLKYTKEEYPNLKNEPYRRVWTQPISTYAKGYNYFDISLAPLVDNNFNIMKSQLKAIESGFHKTPIIASKVAPYEIDLIDGKNALLVPEKKSKKLWHKHMESLIESENMRKELGEALYETVKETYNLNNVTQKRVEAYNSL